MTARVLVVDDEPAMVRTLCDILRMQKWQCEGAASGEEAVTRACAEGFSTVLMDIKMPGIDGVAACRQIRQCSREVRVILMTAHGSAETLAAAGREGAFRVLSKPLDLPSLLTLLK